jgi:hypothetical protein
MKIHNENKKEEQGIAFVMVLLAAWVVTSAQAAS